MSTDDEYRDRIREFDHYSLIQLWKQIENHEADDWADGKAFEYLILRSFELEDAKVRWPYSVEVDNQVIEQIDGVVYVDGLPCLVEAKDRDDAVNFEPIAKLRSQLLRRPSSAIGAIFSREGFTQPAVTLARFLAPQTVLLWYGKEIEHCIKSSSMCASLLAKYRYAVEFGLPDFDVTLQE